MIVLVLVGIAVAVGIPWLLRSREQQRLRMCEKRLGEIAAAQLLLERTAGHFPGFANPLSNANAEKVEASFGSWIVVSLGILYRSELASAWQHGKREARYLPDLVCPAAAPPDPTPDMAWLSYVANCGRGDRLNDPACGVYMDLRMKPPVRITVADLDAHDGAATTLLLSENVQAGRWTSTEAADVGMLWWLDPGACSALNRCREAPSDTHRTEYARPSSNHAHGVNAAYADGHVDFLSDAIEYRVYQQLMAPDDRAAGIR